MARTRVNTKFVIGLCGVLALVALGAAAMKFSTMWRERDPAYLLAQAEISEKAGDNKATMRYLYLAANRARAIHQKGADELFLRVGDMYMAASDKEPKLYKAATDSWQQALTENPRNAVALRKLLDENYEKAKYFRRIEFWNMLEDSAKKLIDLDSKNARAYSLHAEALLESTIVSSVDAVIQAKLSEIISDVTKAMELNPSMPEPVVVRIRTLMLASMRAERGGSAQSAEGLRKQALDLAQSYLEKNPGEPLVSMTLARLYVDFKQAGESRKVLESVCTSHPDYAPAAQLLADLCLRNEPDRSEAALKTLAGAMKDSPEGYYTLGQFCKQTRKLADAIASFKQVADWPKASSGIQSLKNQDWRFASLYELGWLSMDLAEHNGEETADGKSNIAEATGYIDRMRQLRPGDAQIDILEGRVQLTRNNIPQAVQLLKRADGVVSSGQTQSLQWVQIKAMLAKAYSAQSEWGKALDYWDEILAKRPGSEYVILQRGMVLNRIAKYTDALAAADSVLKVEPGNEQAKRIKAQAYLGLNLRDKYLEIIGTFDTPASGIEQVRIKLLNGEADAALLLLKPITTREPDNQAARYLEVLAHMQLKQRDDALKVIDGVLAKDPKNAQWQLMKVSLEQRTGGDLFEAQRKVIEGISDGYTRCVAMAQLYGQSGDHTKEIENYQLAEKALDAALEKDRARMGELVERIFNISLGMALTTKDTAKQKEFWALADQYVRKAEMQDLDGVGGKLFLGRLQMARGDKRAGVQTIELAVVARSDYSPAHTILAQAYYDADRLDQSLEEYRKAIDIKPDNIVAMKGAIRILVRKADAANLEQAANYLEKALIFARNDPQLQAFSDIIGKPEAAIVQREKIYQQTPNNEENARRLGFLYLRVNPKQFDKAIEIYKKLYDAHPDDLDLADSLARLYRETSKVDEARAILEKFTASTDANTRYAALLSLADLYRSLSKTEDAVKTFREAISKQPEGVDEALRRLADMYFDLDDLPHAEEVYQQLYDGPASKDGKVLRRLIETLVRQEKYPKAEDLLETRILKQHPDDPEGLVLRGFALLRQRRATEAIACFDKVLEKNSSNLDALHYRAFAQYYLQGNLDQAATDLVKVRDRNPNALNSRLLLARVYRLAHRYPEASKEYQDVIAMRPELIPARVEYADFLYGLVDNLQRLSPDSSDEFATAIRTTRPNENLDGFLADSLRRFPDQPIWRVIQGRVQSLRGRPAEAQRTLEEAFRTSNESPLVASSYLASLLQGRNYEEAVTLTTRLIKVHPEYSDYYVKRGTAYAGMNRSDEALDDFDKALELSSKDMSGFLEIVRQAIQTADPTKAIDHLKARLTKSPKDIPTRFSLAQALLNASRYGEAITMIDGLMVDADAAGIRTPLLRVRALARYQDKQYEDAKKDYLELLRTDPEDLEALNNLAFMLAENMNNPKDAKEYAARGNKILRTKPVSPAFVNNGNLYDTYGWVMYLNNETETAIRELKRANQIEALPITYYHLARIYHAQKQDDDARRAAKEAVRLGTQRKDAMLATMQQLLKELGG